MLVLGKNYNFIDIARMVHGAPSKGELEQIGDRFRNNALAEARRGPPHDVAELAPVDPVDLLVRYRAARTRYSGGYRSCSDRNIQARAWTFAMVLMFLKRGWPG
jgi:hypothetical protein